MINLLKALLKTLRNGLQSREQLMLENLLLRHQITVKSSQVPIVVYFGSV